MSDTIIAALIAGCVAVLGSFLAHFGAESYRRFRDRVALAGALAGELASYEEAFAIARASFQVLAEDSRRGAVANIAKLPVPDDPVFGKTAEKLGLLGPHLAEAVAYVYGQLRGFRAAVASMPVGDGVVATQQIGHIVLALHFLNKASERGVPTIDRLREVARSGYADYLFGG
jgi:hypothetical protein